VVKIARVVLAVGVDLHKGVVFTALGIKEGRAHGTANADIEGEGDHLGTGLTGEFRCAVG